MFSALPELELKNLNGEQTSLVIVDMLNGFTREGALRSSRIEVVIPEIAELSKKCDEFGIAKLAFGDSHTEASPEFAAYPPHCMEGTSEEEIVDELKEIGGYTLIPKNSTNGFLEEEFQNWISQNQDVNTFIIIGNCTDICIQQFAVTLKTWFNKKNEMARIIVPLNAVETYDLGLHDGDLVNVMALLNMLINGIELVAAIK
jgi:nicotinamidase-related amidase